LAFSAFLPENYYTSNPAFLQVTLGTEAKNIVQKLAERVDKDENWRGERFEGRMGGWERRCR
jgi:hypothetical protein